MTNKSIWEILVPTVRNDGRPFRTRYHRVWDAKIKEISGGMTISSAAKGKWVSPEGKVFEEKMLPVMIMATDEEMSDIVDFTLKYYDQEAVFAFKISDTYILRHRND